MSKKQVGIPNDPATLAAILKRLYDVKMEHMKQGKRVDGSPLTEADFAAVNLARKALRKHGVQV